MNEPWIWRYIFLEEEMGEGGGGGGGPHNVEIILGGVVTKWWCLITKGDAGVKNLGESDYIICECLLTM